MANFSVEWLSKSYYTTQKDTEEAILQATTQFKDDSVQTKINTDGLLHTEIEGHGKQSRSQYTPTSPNNSCGYSSGSESEVGDDSEGEATQQRRMRTKFTSEQISKLEKTFSKHKYLGATQRRAIAEKLNLSETQVKTWFQNRRMKLKREVQDMRPEFLSSPAGLLPPLLFQHPSLSGQLPAYSHSAFHPQPLHRIQFPPQLPVQQHHLHPVILPPAYY
ncbi:ventral expressed homeobox [Myripristis murdjan]|uniref:ventral expressed homeobox n=1 Tax=Myripristis murdjan TaxID=586833 RepID=UPI001175F44E|nr:homeobox protein vent1-like [Myripristis murdjan]